MNFSKLAVTLPAVALLALAAPESAEARTKSIVKYGAIGLGAAALYGAGQQSAYNNSHYGGGYGYSHYPSYGYGGGYYQQPHYSYSYPSYGYGGHYGGGYYY